MRINKYINRRELFTWILIILFIWFLFYGGYYKSKSFVSNQFFKVENRITPEVNTKINTYDKELVEIQAGGRCSVLIQNAERSGVSSNDFFEFYCYPICNGLGNLYDSYYCLDDNFFCRCEI